jgi:hypothetical protein
MTQLLILLLLRVASLFFLSSRLLALASLTVPADDDAIITITLLCNCDRHCCLVMKTVKANKSTLHVELCGDQRILGYNRSRTPPLLVSLELVAKLWYPYRYTFNDSLSEERGS